MQPEHSLVIDEELHVWQMISAPGGHTGTGISGTQEISLTGHRSEFNRGEKTDEMKTPVARPRFLNLLPQEPKTEVGGYYLSSLRGWGKYSQLRQVRFSYRMPAFTTLLSEAVCHWNVAGAEAQRGPMEVMT